MGNFVGKYVKFIVMKGVYKGRNVTLMKPRRLKPGDISYGRKKFEVYVIDGNRTKRVTFGSPTMSIKKHIKKNRDSFLARHKCNTANDPTTARYWSCQKWL